MQTLVSSIISRKGADVYTIGSRGTVFDAIVAMDCLNIGALVVTDDDHAIPRADRKADAPYSAEQVIGIFTERDYLRKVALVGLPRETPVADVMTTDLLIASTHTRVEEAMSLMTTARVRHLPVFEDGLMVGIISIGDLVKAISREQEAVVKYLQDVLTGIPAIMPRFR
ncbi:MAG: CBS domain-containing protein [Planctomycetota bacterium]